MLGICVVYLVMDKSAEFLLEMNLQRLLSNTDAPYKIYGVALRLSDDLADKLRESGVILPEIPEFKLAEYKNNAKAVGEHSYYLDQLVDYAFLDGCTHVTTFDMDSWPISNKWNTFYYRFLTEDTPVIAMQRFEIKDNFPSPAFTMIHRSFWRIGQSSFAFFNPRCIYKRGGKSISRPISGAGILAELRMREKKFLPLLRTNRWNPHPIMCGIYDHNIFHFGAGSRQPIFSSDEIDYELIDTEISRSYARIINGAKRAFFLKILKDSEQEFMNQLMKRRSM